jgi:hypothetical protein
MRVVQALGLHRDPTHFGLPPLEVFERRRVFWEVGGSFDSHDSCDSCDSSESLI